MFKSFETAQKFELLLKAAIGGDKQAVREITEKYEIDEDTAWDRFSVLDVEMVEEELYA